MTTIRDAVEGIYQVDGAFGKHLVFVILGIIVASCILFWGEDSYLTYVIIAPLGLYFFGFVLQMMQNEIKNNSPLLPNFGFNNLKVAIKFIPVSVVCSLILFLTAATIGHIPVLGQIIYFVVGLVITSLPQVLFSENFKIIDGLNFKKIWNLASGFFWQLILLVIKFFVFFIFIIGPILLISFTFLKNNIFVLATIFSYLFIISQLVYYNCLAQLYSELIINENKSEYNM